MEASEGIWLALAATSAALYFAIVAGFVLAMLRRRLPRVPRLSPRVSILKPLAGMDDELEQNLWSFAALEYPSYEIVLGVASLDDSAYPAARRFADRMGPDRARLVVTDPCAALNPKIAQLISLERAAAGDVMVVSDSNVRVAPGYLHALMGELSAPGVAAVSSIVAGSGERSFGAAVENLQLGAIITPGIVASAFFTGRIITLGKSMAMWREPLQRIGGFARVANYLSDDHVLGTAFAESGYGVRVSLWPVENRNVVCSLGRTIERHTRWAKIRRAMKPRAFLLEPILSPVVIATLACLASPTRSSALVLMMAMALQGAGAVLTNAMLRREAPRWYWMPLEILRSYLLFFCWFCACLTHRVSWRGHAFQLSRDSAIVPAQPGVWHRVRALVRA